MINTSIFSSASLYAHLTHQPQALKFGTSGRRGEVVHLTQLEVYINALAELEYLQTLPVEQGGICLGDEFYFAYDLRPSSSRFVPEQQGRGEIAQAIVQAIRDAGLIPVNLGQIPTPALAFYALEHGKGSIMVTGSHIPFDRNGYKTNTAKGELLKQHEGPINEKVLALRQRLYAQPYADSLFDASGCFKYGHHELPPATEAGESAYSRRYVDFFGEQALQGLRIAVYQHSAVGRDWLVKMLRALGAEAVPFGRSETFIPIDTENLGLEQLAAIQALYDECAAVQGEFDAVVSTDGDSDRPMILGVEAGKLQFYNGDRVGMVTAQFLGADAVVVPISCNDAIDRGPWRDITAPKTKIGSPFVIDGMEKAIAAGKRAVCGFEANGGFLTACSFFRQGKNLSALPTRDAVLPILAVLLAAKEQGAGLAGCFARLPKRYGKSALLKNFPRQNAEKILRRFGLQQADVTEMAIVGEDIHFYDEDRGRLAVSAAVFQQAAASVGGLAACFSPSLGFAPIGRVNYLDGIRLYFDNGDIAHVRPSGNADELRIYALADTEDRANAIVALAVQEPDGILWQLYQAATA